MLWGYLGEFWDKIIQVGDYTIDWFQGIGNAVAGAIGGLFEDLVHHIYDLFYVIWWIGEGLGDLFSILIRPLVWVFNFGKGFFDVAFKTAEQLGLQIGEIAGFGADVFQFLNAIPYFEYITLGVGSVIGLLFLGFIIKKLVEF